MTNSKLSKLYLITSETLNKLNKISEKKIVHRKNKNVDFFRTLKNLRQKKNLLNENETNKFNQAENILKNLTLKYKTNKDVSNYLKPISSQSKKLVNFGTQSEIVDKMNREAQTEWNREEEVPKSSKDLETQTMWNEDEIPDVDDRATQTEWNEEEFSKSLRDLETQTIWDEDEITDRETQTEWEEAKLPSDDDDIEMEMQVTPAKSKVRNPLLLRLPKRSATPLNKKLNKVKITNDGAIPVNSSISSLVTQPTKRQKQVIQDMRKSAISGSRKAKQKAKTKLQELYRWKHI